MLGDDDPVEDDAVRTLLAAIHDTSSSWVIFYNSCFQSTPPVQCSVTDVEQLLRLVPLSALTCISGFVAQTALLKRQLGLYARSIFTCSAQVVICLTGLEQRSFSVEISKMNVLKLESPAVEWSPHLYITGACMLPVFLNTLRSKRRVAEVVFSQVFNWAFSARNS